jgi:hypothetical protein
MASKAAQKSAMFSQLVGAGMDPGAAGALVNRPGGNKKWGQLFADFSSTLAQLQSNNRMRQLQQQMMQAQQAQASRMAALLKPKSQLNTLVSTLSSGQSGVRSRRSRTQQLAMDQGVRASNQLQAGPYLGPQGGRSATPYGSSINLA